MIIAIAWATMLVPAIFIAVGIVVSSFKITKRRGASYLAAPGIDLEMLYHPATTSVASADDQRAVDSFIEAAKRLAGDGSRVTHIAIGDRFAVVGYRSQFKLRWVATKLHLFTVLLPTEVATASELAALTAWSLEYGIAKKGRLRGLQSGIATLPVLVTAHVERDAAASATREQDRTWLVFGRPAVMDVTNDRLLTFEGRSRWGAIYSSWLLQRLATIAGPA